MIIVGLSVALIIGVATGWIIHAARPATRPTPRPPTSDPPTEQPVPSDFDEVGDALRETVDHLDDAVLIYDADAREIYRNRPASAMVGTHVGVIVDEVVDEVVALAAAEERVERPVELHGPPRQSLIVHGGRLSGGRTMAIVEDVSERKRIDAMRTDFVANISHELKTPVGAIAVLAETLEGETDPLVAARLTRRIGEEAHRAVETIDDLLELSRIEAEGVGDDVVDLAAIIEAAMDRGRAADPSVTVTAIGASAPMHLRADRRQLVSALGNLLENAVKYSDGGGEVQVRTRVNDRQVEIMVTDSGMGIPQRDLLRVFERFYRVDRSRRRETGGTGLGLAIVRHVATNHGGDVVVSSEEGKGSTFVFRLPATLTVDVETTCDTPAPMKEDV